MVNSQKILLVEDDPGIIELLSDFLIDEGYEVTTRSSGGAALLELASNSYAVMLLDMGLPDMTGNDVLAQLVSQVNPTPVIVVSANANQLRYRDRVQAVVHKPFDLFGLLEVIEQVLVSQ
jgi:two-component system, OmpR family, KDP operon response regulator KdpE